MPDQIEFFVEVEQEADGRWLAEVADLPGVLAYGSTADEATSRAQILAELVLLERLQEGGAKA
jgi:predicted RNase H-like HicB family nuclease